MQCSNQITFFLEKFLATLYVPEISLDFKYFNNSQNLKNEILKHEYIIEFPNDTLSFNIYFEDIIFQKIVNSEVNSEYHRISEQIKNVDLLFNSKAQPAWILVTTYYASFFIANLINRLLGRASINFSSEQIKTIFTNDSAPSLSNELQEILRNLTNSSNHSYTCIIERSQLQNQIKLRLIPGGDRPHQAVWSDLFHNINKISRLNFDHNEFELLKKIMNPNEKKFPIPSQLRNEWNYADQKYFSEIGTRTANKFIQLLKNKNALQTWVTLQSTDKNLRINSLNEDDQICSLAFIYNILKEIFNILFINPTKTQQPKHNTSTRRMKYIKKKS